MTLKRLRLKNFRRHEDTDLTFEDTAQLTLIAGQNGAGKCLPGSTRVHDGATGESLTLEQFVNERRDTALGYTDGKVAPVPVSDWLSLGVKDTVLVELADGTEMQMAKTHPVLTDQGCIRAGELTTDHHVAQAAHTPHLGDTPVSPEEAYIVGMLISAGSVTPDDVALVDADPAAVAELQHCLDIAFPGLAVEPTPGAPGEYTFTASTTVAEASFNEWVAELGPLSTVPANMLFMPEDHARYLLAGLWQADDWGTPGTTHLITTHDRLALDVKQLLLRFGQVATVTPAAGGGWQVNAPAARHHTAEGLAWFKVARVVEAGPVECFDLTVGTAEHLYLAETWVVHNSSILEGLKYAAYGVGRSTKTKLDDLVRVGAELEGFTVELDFEYGGQDCTVVRHYEDGMSHASLTMGGTVVTQGPREVTAYFTQLFGMDARGFDLAVFATQKQLNGLTSMSAAKRAQMVSRLVRADVFTKARDDARVRMNDTKRLLQNLGELPEVTDLEEARDARREELEAAVGAQTDAIAAAEALEADLRERSDVQEKFRQATERQARADGQVEAARKALADAKDQLARAEESMTDRPDVPDEDLAALEDELDELSERLSRAREAEAADHDRKVLGGEIETLTKQRDELQEKVGKFRDNVDATSAVVKAEQALKAFRHELEDITSTGQDTNAKLAVATSELKAAEDAVERLTGLDAVCPTCEQGIPDEHRDSQVEHAKQKVTDADALRRRLEDELQQLREDRAAKISEVKEAEKALDDARATEAAVAGEERQLAQVERTLSMYQRRHDALPPSGEPSAPLAEKRARVSTQIQAVRGAERALREWERAENTRLSAETALQRAQLTLDQSEADLKDAQVPQDLAEAVDALGVVATKLAAERDLASECTTLAAIAEQRLAAAEQQLSDVQNEADRRAKLVDEVEQSEAAARLLTASASHMTSRIRPALEGVVGSILATMSEGRFDSVKIDRNYNISVQDDGVYRPLAEMSGGEQDLVALALRLGLARVVSASHGTTGPGFLVLDEVFGSQDAGRREAILNGLKTLRKVFPQILLVSHVEGAEDKVDQVIRVERVDPDDSAGTLAAALVTAE